MKTRVMRRAVALLLTAFVALPLIAARQSFTKTSTFNYVSEGVLTASEEGCNWTVASGFFSMSDMGVRVLKKMAQTQSGTTNASITSAYTVTGTLTAVKITAEAALTTVYVKVGSNTLGMLEINNELDKTGPQTLSIPIVSGTDVTAQPITLEFKLNESSLQGLDAACLFSRVEVSYLEPKKAAGLSFSSHTASGELGSTITPPTLNNPNNLSVTWNSGTPDVATVASNNGKLTINKVGTTRITVIFSGNDEYLAGSDYYDLTVKAPTLTAPTFSLAAGTYDAAQALTLTTNKSGADIYYTIDGGTAQKYTAPITVSNTCTVGAYIQYMGYTSATATRQYTIRQATTLNFTPTTATATIGDSFTPPTLSNPDGVSVTWSSSTPAVATVNGSGAVTLKAAGQTTITATFAGDATRLPATASYTLTVNAPTLTAPTFSLAAGTYDAAQTLTLTTNKTGADIYYTIDGGTAQKYTAPITVSQSCTIGAYIQYMGYTSATATRQYTIRQEARLSFPVSDYVLKVSDQPAPPTLSNPYGVEVEYTISDPDVATINSTDGTLELRRPGTATVTATFNGNGQYLPATATYELTVQEIDVKSPTFSLAPGSYDGQQTLEITAEDGARIIYSLDGFSFMGYYEPIILTESCTVYAYAELYECRSDQVTATYVIRRDPNLSFTESQYEYTPGDELAAPELNNPYGVEVEYSSSDTEVATVSADGTLDIRRPGTATITATFKGNEQYLPATATYELTVHDLDVKAPTFSLAPGTYDGPQTLELYAEDGARIIYSLDGFSFMGYYEPITLTESCTVYAYAELYECRSDQVTATYDIRQPVVTDSTDVEGAYKLWVNGIRVTTDNRLDILGDKTDGHNPTVMFDGDRTLVLTNAALDSIVSQLPNGLTVYLLGDNTIHSDAGAAIHSTLFGQQPPLVITTDGNHPGTLALTSPAATIEGFAATRLEQQLRVVEDETSSTLIAAVIYPFTYLTTIYFRPQDFITTDGSGQRVDVDLTNQVVNNMLFTLDMNGDDGYDEEREAIVLNTPNSLYPIPNTLYADGFTGFTFMVPPGNGEIFIDHMEDGYLMGVCVGSDTPQHFYCDNWERSTIPYSVNEPTYVRVFNVGPNNADARGRVGKKTTGRVVIRSIVIKPAEVNTSNAVQEYIPEAQTEDNHPFVGTGIAHISHLSTLDSHPSPLTWYNLNGQRISSPRQKGIFIHNGRKTVVK